MPLRAMPHVGQRVTVCYLATTAEGEVAEVGDGGRSLFVVTDDGEAVRFRLSRATATFTAGGAAPWPRLVFGS